MTGHDKFSKLLENISPERKARIDQKTAQVKQELALYELQQEFLEKQTDLSLNHLRQIIAVMGGELIIAIPRVIKYSPHPQPLSQSGRGELD